MSDLMKFRTAYIKAIAESWRDAKFLANLKKDPIKQLNNAFGYVFPWDVELVIESVSAKDSLWSPENAGGWVGRNAVISIWLPPAPKEVEDYARAWAAYYDEFPSYLGSVGNESPQYSSGPVIKQSYPLGMGKESDFLEFSAVIMRLIAMAWKDQQIQNELKAVADTNKGVTILNKWLGFNMPWNMDVRFKLSGWDDKTSSAEEKKCRWNSAQKEWPKPRPNSCRNGLHFYIPNKPEKSGKDTSIEAIALSAYNVTGDQYPFTCP